MQHLHRYDFCHVPDCVVLKIIGRVHLMSAENKMNPSDLGVVWSREFCCFVMIDTSQLFFTATLLRSPIAGREFR